MEYSVTQQTFVELLPWAGCPGTQSWLRRDLILKGRIDRTVGNTAIEAKHFNRVDAALTGHSEPGAAPEEHTFCPVGRGHGTEIQKAFQRR